MKQIGFCPKCGGFTEAEWVHNGVDYIYPPLWCPSCGWSERCPEWGDIETCERCTEYEKCYSRISLKDLFGIVKKLKSKLATTEARVKEFEAQIEDLDNMLTYMKAETKERVQELEELLRLAYRALTDGMFDVPFGGRKSLCAKLRVEAKRKLRQALGIKEDEEDCSGRD